MFKKKKKYAVSRLLVLRNKQYILRIMKDNNPKQCIPSGKFDWTFLPYAQKRNASFKPRAISSPQQ
jgi:hypothetical protein